MTLNPFSNMQLPDQESEIIIQAKQPAALDEAVLDAYKVYEGLESIPFQENQLRNIKRLEININLLEKQILSPGQIFSPGQIDSLLQVIRFSTSKERLDNPITGFYLSRLIQYSYNAGNNGFVLTTGDTHIDNIGLVIRGEEDRKLRLQVNGSVGNQCVKYIKFGNITIYGNASGWCGEGAYYSEITVIGNARHCFGREAKHSKIIVSGNVDYDFGAYARDTIFITYTKQAYSRCKESANAYLNSGNIIQLVNSSGKILKEEHL